LRRSHCTSRIPSTEGGSWAPVAGRLTAPQHIPIVTAIFNTSPDIVDLMRRAFEPAGIVVVSVLTHQIREGGRRGCLPQAAQARRDRLRHRAPYDANWQLFQHIRRMEAMGGRPVVLTSINPRHVEELAGRDETIYEVVGKPIDLDRIVRAVKEAARSRSTR
jgi:hypothetical protein